MEKCLKIMGLILVSAAGASGERKRSGSKVDFGVRQPLFRSQLYYLVSVSRNFLSLLACEIGRTVPPSQGCQDQMRQHRALPGIRRALKALFQKPTPPFVCLGK